MLTKEQEALREQEELEEFRMEIQKLIMKHMLSLNPNLMCGMLEIAKLQLATFIGGTAFEQVKKEKGQSRD